MSIAVVLKTDLSEENFHPTEFLLLFIKFFMTNFKRDFY